MISTTAMATLNLRRPGSAGAGRPSIGGGGTPEDNCPNVGMACMVHPAECSARPDTWVTSGTVECVRGEEVCVATARVDYCNICGQTVRGESCGSCNGQSCRTDADCPITALCDTLSGEGGRCRSRAADCPTGALPSGVCWQPEENASKFLVCP